MRRSHSQSSRGSVLLVALCFVTVLGISLASYIAVCSRAMQISNRTAQTGLSRQLAELGLEEALRAINKNDWSDWSNGPTADWTVSGTTATANLTFPAGTFGQGVTGSVKIRVDNYNAAQLGSAWNSSANYQPGNLVSYTDGTWYRCIALHTNKTPAVTSSNNMYWMQEQSAISSSMTWISGTNYVLGNMILRNGSWYRCVLAHTASTSNNPPNATYWASVPYLTADADLRYVAGSIVNYYGSWYRYTGSGWDGPLSSGYNPTWSPTFYWRPSTTYNIGDVVWITNVWYRCKTAHVSGASFSSTNWDTAATTATTAAAAWNWSSSITYNLNDAVYYSGRWYRSTVESNQNNTPSTSSAFWSISPLLSRSWDSTRQYSANDTAYHNGVWYLSLANSNYNQNPSTQTGWWRSTAVTAFQWNSTTAYSVGAYRSYGGIWYRCLVANTGQSPNNSTYWAAAWAQSSGVTTGAPVIYAEGTINLAGSGSTKTQLRATIAPAPLFPNAIAATSNLTISGGGTVSSYDSVTDPTAATPGYSAVLASTGTTNPAMTVTSTSVNGYVAAPSATTAPYAPMWSYGGSAVVKGAAIGTGIDTTRVSRSPYIPKFDIQTVSGGTMLSTRTATLGTAGATTPSIYYFNDAGVVNLRLDEATEILTIVGPVILYVTGNFRIDSNAGAKVIIAPTGSLRLVVARDFNIESTGGGIDNQTKDPSKLTVLCSRVGTDTFLYAATAQPFYGTIYIPNSSSTLTIGAGVTIYGAISAQNITFSGDANVFYDTSLRNAVTPGVDQPYGITEWRELTDAIELANLP